MKILVGLSKGIKSENVPYQMFIVDVDSTEPIKQEWEPIKIEALASCSNIRVNLGNYKSVTQNPLEYLEAEFDLSKLVDISANQQEFQIINVYKDEIGDPILFRTVNSLGEVQIHHITELPYKKIFSIYGDNLEALPSYVKTLSLKDAYEWWAKKDKEKVHRRTTRFVYENFDTHEDMPVQVLYHYLVGVKGFKLGYHTITENNDKYIESSKLHEYFLYNGTANIKLRESIPTIEPTVDEVGIFGNKDPYPDTRKLGYFGATMSLICNRKNYPAFDYYSKPTSEANYDKDGIEVTIDITDGNMAVYNKFEEAGCIATEWRIGEGQKLFGVTLTNLLTDKLLGLSRKFQEDKERVEFGHWSTANTNDWFQVMSFALSTQFYSKDLRNKLTAILNDFQYLFSSKLAEMIERISAKDSLETMKWAEENVEKVMEDISFMKEDESIQKSNVTIEQMKNLFTFKRNNYDLPDWLQIYSPETIEKLGGVDYLTQFIATRGEASAELFLSMWAEKLESDQKYVSLEPKEEILEQIDKLEETPVIPAEKNKSKKAA